MGHGEESVSSPGLGWSVCSGRAVAGDFDPWQPTLGRSPLQSGNLSCECAETKSAAKKNVTKRNLLVIFFFCKVRHHEYSLILERTVRILMSLVGFWTEREPLNRPRTISITP